MKIQIEKPCNCYECPLQENHYCIAYRQIKYCPTRGILETCPFNENGKFIKNNVGSVLFEISHEADKEKEE